MALGSSPPKSATSPRTTAFSPAPTSDDLSSTVASATRRSRSPPATSSRKMSSALVGSRLASASRAPASASAMACDSFSRILNRSATR